MQIQENTCTKKGGNAMKRKIALAMSLAMVLTAMPVNGLTAYAEDIIVEEADETLLSETSFEAEPIGEVTVEDVPAVVEENTEDAVPENTVKEPEAGTEIPEVSPEDAGETTVEETTKVVDDELSGEMLSLGDEILVEEITVEETEVAEKTVEAGTSGEFQLPASIEMDGSKEGVYTANITNSKGVYFKFTPKTSGTYTFYSDSTDQDTYGYLYKKVTDGDDEYLSCLTSDDDSGQNLNFMISYSLSNKDEYYLNARFYDSYCDGSYNVIVTSLDLSKERIEHYLDLSNRNAENCWNNVVLSVEDITIESGIIDSENTGTNISYQWKNSDLSVIDDANNAAYTLDSISSGNTYICTISDGFSSRDVVYDLIVSTGLIINSLLPNDDWQTDKNGVAQSDIYLDYQEEIELIIDAETKQGNLNYVWKDSSDRELENTTNAFTITGTQNTEYYCVISDEYESITVCFHIFINSRLYIDSCPPSTQIVEMGSDVSLEIYADTEENYKPLTIKWENSNEESYVGNTYVINNISEKTVIKCTVSDSVDSIEKEFTVIPKETINGGNLGAGSSITVLVSPQNKLRYSIVPIKTCTYYITSYITSGEGTYTALYNADNSMLSSDLGRGYTIEAVLRKGETYYIETCSLNEEEDQEYSLSIYQCDCHFVEEDRYESCTEEGYVYYYCEFCGNGYGENLPPKGCSADTWTVTQAPTCTTNGLQIQKCKVCGTVFNQQVISATGHSFGGFVTTQSPNALTAGTEVRTCSNCGLQESRPIPQLAGTIKLSATKLPLQLKKTVNLNRLVTSMTEGDYVLSWKSSNSKIASVKGSKVTGKKAGKATLTVTLASGVTKNVTVTVQKGAVKTSGISNIKTKMTMKKGEKVSLKPVISPISTFDKVTYSTSNKKVATVSSNGVITAKASGSAKITVKSGSKKVVINVKVPKTAPTAITGVPTSKTLKKGKSLTLKPKLSPKGAEAKITYKSSNSKVATVNANGKITAKKKGTAVITVKAGNVKATCTITVK